MTATQSRALGFDWPGPESMDQDDIEPDGEVDLEAPLVGSRTASRSLRAAKKQDAEALVESMR